MSRVLPSDASYKDFSAGASDHVTPMSAIDKKMLNFAIKTKEQPATMVHGQILNHFGMLPPEFWTRVQHLSQHPEIHSRTRNRLINAFPVLSAAQQ